jgi:hypothetical protein
LRGVQARFIKLSPNLRNPVIQAPHNENLQNSTGIIVMQTFKHNSWQEVRINLLYSAIGLSALSLLVAWSIELLAETLFLNW